MITLDSFKIRIPINRVGIRQPEYFDIRNYQLVNTASGMIVPDAQSKKSIPTIGVFDDSVRIRLAIEKQRTADQTNGEFFVMSLNSKLLKTCYQEGIHSDNIGLFFDNLMNCPEVNTLVDIDSKAFLKGQLTDTDFKEDFPCTREVFEASVIRFKKVLGVDNSDIKYFQQKDNLGVQFSDRKTTEIAKKPFLKWYYKLPELHANHPRFTNAFLQDQDLSKGRLEYTIKNKKHWDAFKVEDNSLNGILAIPEDVKKRMQQKAMQAYLGKIKKPEKPKSRKVAPKAEDVITLFSMEREISAGVPFADWRVLIKGQLEAAGLHRKTVKSKLDHYDHLYRLHVEGSPEDRTMSDTDFMLTKIFPVFFDRKVQELATY